jgi:hypothetical protein
MEVGKVMESQWRQFQDAQRPARYWFFPQWRFGIGRLEQKTNQKAKGG